MFKTHRKLHVRKVTFSAMFLAIGLVLPFFSGQIPQIGSMLLPMHLPVFLCGMICGGGWGGIVGFILPLLRYALFGMPPIFPKGIAMAFELAAYGMISGYLYYYLRNFKMQKIVKNGDSGKRRFSYIYAALVPSMVLGRFVWGIVFAVLCGMTTQAFTFKMFIMGAYVEAIPGIVLQLIVIPILVKTILNTNIWDVDSTRITTGKIIGGNTDE